MVAKNDKGVCMALKFRGSYLNRYEQAHDLYQDNAYFNQADWDTLSKRGDLDMYAAILQDSSKLPSYDALNKEYRMDLMDTSTRMTLYANELYGDRTNTDEKRTEDTYDEMGNVTGTNEYTMSDYEYTKKLLKEQTDKLVKIEARKIAQQQKEENSNFFTNFVGGINEFLIGGMEVINDLFSLAEGVYDGFASMANGGSFDEGFRNAFNTSEGGSADWRPFDNVGWTDALVQWNIDNTDIRDLDGNMTSNLAGVWGQLTRMVGQYLPFTAIGKAAGAAGASAKVASGISQGMYYTSLSAANLREFASNPAYASVPTWAIATNAAAKGAVEYLVQAGLNKLMGASTLDRLVFGITKTAGKGTAKITAGSALKRIGMDAFHEGIEEVFQQYGDWLVDQAFAVKYNDFKYKTDISGKTILMSFILGALGSFGASALSVAASATGDIVSSLRHQFVVTKNPLKSWSFKQTMNDMAQQYSTVMNDKTISADTKRAVAGQMYVNYRAIASFYNVVGQEQFNQALELLNRISDPKYQLTDVMIERYATDLMQQVHKMPAEAAANALKEVVKNAHLQEPTAVVEADTDIADLPADVKEAAVNIAKDIIAKDTGVNKVIFVDGGATAVQVGDTMLVPQGMTDTFTADGIIKSAQESTIVANILASPKLAHSIESLTDLYEQVYNVTTNNTKVVAVYNALFNPEFRAIIWGVANQDLYNFMSNLNETIAAASKGTPSEAKFTQKLKATLAEMQKELIAYCINQTNANFDDLTFLSNDMKQYIHDSRWNKTMYQNVLKGKATAQDLAALSRRVNAAPIDAKRKSDITDKLNSDKENVRLSGLRELDYLYDHAWTSPYDGTKYLPNDSIPNNFMNTFMQENGLDITLLEVSPLKEYPAYEQIMIEKGDVTPETTLSFYRDQFQMFTNNQFDFTVIDGKVVITELDKETQQGYETYSENLDSIYSGKYRQNKQSIVRTEYSILNLVTPYLNRELDAVTKANIKISDVIYNPTYLSKNTLDSIRQKYGKVTPQTTFLHMRDMFLNKTKGKISIVMRNDGSFTFVNITPMLDVLHKQNVKFKEGDHRASEYFKSEFLEGSLKDMTIKAGHFNGDTYYDSDTNTIYLDIDGDNDFITFSLLHEFQHALAAEESLLRGTAETWLSQSKSPKSYKDKFVADVKKHRPELFKNEPKERYNQIAEQFVYNTTGEYFAYGMASEWDIVDFYPTLVKDKGNGTIEIVMPWGSRYTFTYDITTKQSIVNRYRKTALLANMYTADDGTQFRLSMTAPQNYPGGGGIILQDGSIFGAPAGIGDVHGPVQKKVSLNLESEPIVTIHFIDKSISRSGYPEYAIDIDNVMPKAEYMATAELITQLQNRGHIVTLTRIDKNAKGKVTGTKTLRVDDFMLDGDGMLQELGVITQQVYNKQMMANDTKKKLLDYPVYREINEWFKEALPDREMQPNSLCGLILPDGTIGYTSQYWTHLEVTRAAATHFAPEGKDVKIDKFNNHVVEIALNGRFGNGFQDSISIRINGSMNIDMQESLTNLIDEALMHNANLEIEHKPTGVYITADPSMTGREVMRDLRRYVNTARGRVSNMPEDVNYTRENPRPKENVVAEQTAQPIVEEPKVEEAAKEEPKTEPVVKELPPAEPKEKKQSVRPKRQNTKYITKEEAGQNKKGQTIYKYTYAHNTYVSNKDAEKSNLKYFIRKNRPIQMSTDMQEFIVNANKYNVPEHIWKKIEQGTLTRQDVMDEFRKSDTMDRTTFNLYNKAFFHNEHVKSYKTVENFVEGTAMADYYALRVIMRKVGLIEESMWSMSRESIVQLVKDWLKIPDIKKLYDRIRLRYSSYKGQPIEINREAAKITFMKYYDGSVNSLAKIASIVKYIAVNGWDVAGQVKTAAGDKKAQTKRHQEDLDFTIEESIADETATEAFEEVEDTMSREERRDLRQEILNYYAEQIRGQDLHITKDAMVEAVNNLTDDQLRNFFAKIEISDITARKLSNEEMNKVLKGEDKAIVKTKKSIYQSIYQTAASIRNNLSPNEKKKFLEAHSDLFTDDLKVKPEAYTGKSFEDAAEVRDEIKKISADVRAGVYESKTTEKIVKSLQYWRKRAKNKSVAKYREQAKGNREYKAQELKFNNNEFVIDSTIEIPVQLKKILDTTFDEFAKTDVKYLTTEGEVHVKMNLKKFEEENCQRFAQFTDKDVQDIIDYYSHAVLVGRTNEESIRKFNAFKLYVLGYLHKLGTDGVLHITAEQMTLLDEMIRMTATGAGTDLSVFQSILKWLNPNKAIVQSIAKSAGIEFREEDIDKVTESIKTGNVKKIEAAMTNMYEQGLKLYTGSKKSFLDKLWKFQRMAMLSSPGTWIRNIVSNSLVKVGNDAGAVLGNLFLRKHRQGQYKLTGKSPVELKTQKVGKEWRQFGKIKVDNKYAHFIKDQIIDSGLMNLTTEGLNKYDIRKMDKHNQTGVDILTDLIIHSVTTKIFNQNQFDTKFMNTLGKALFKVLSDDPWINRRTISYLGKMMQEDNIDISKGLSQEVMEAYAEAYTLAAWDYMHKPNFFTNIDQGIRQRAGEAGYFLWKQLMPFATASWNWFMEGLNYTPIGMVKGFIQYARLEKTIDKMEEVRRKGDQMPSSRFAEYLAKRTFGKGVIGTIGLMIGIGLGAAGWAGVDEDDDKIKLKFGDLYIDVSDLFGTSSLLIGIAMSNPWKNTDATFGERFWDAMTQTFDQLFMDSTFSDLYNEFEYTDTFADWLLQQPASMLSTFVPNIIKTFNGLLYNHKIQYSSGIMYGFESFVIQSIPGIAYAFPKKVDPYTGEVKQKYNVPFIFDFVNRMGPVDFKPYNVSDVQREAIAQGVQKTDLTGKYTDIPAFNNKQRQLLNETYGQLNNQDLKKLYNDQIIVSVKDKDGNRVELRYSQMSSEQKKSAIESVMTDNAKLAKIYVYTQSGGKYYATDSEYQKLRAAGILKNVFRETNKLKGFK